MYKIWTSTFHQITTNKMSKFKGQENLKNLQIQHEIITHNCAPYDILMPV